MHLKYRLRKSVGDELTTRTSPWITHVHFVKRPIVQLHITTGLKARNSTFSSVPFVCVILRTNLSVFARLKDKNK